MRADVLGLRLPLRGLALPDVRADLIAGITVSLVAVPQSLAYAQLAGVPPIFGLYAAFIPTIVGALLGSSQLLSTGPVAMTSLLTAASVAPLVGAASDQFIPYVVMLSLLSGLFQLLFGVLRMGVLLNFLSHPVLMGFINAAAIIIALSQLPMLLGIPLIQTNHFLLDIGHVLYHIDKVELLTLGFGLTSLLMLVLFKRKAPSLPGVLITVALLTVVSAAIGFERLGGRVVGSVPEGLPGLSLPPLDWRMAVHLLPASFVIALISFMEAMSSAKIIAIRTRTPWDENRELIGQGIAKIAAAFCHSMPVSGSFSRSALNLAAGARSKLSSLVSAAFVLATLLYLTPLLYHLPKAVLAAIIMVAVANLVNIRIIQNAWRAHKDDGIAGLVTFAATLAFAPNIQIGILTGIMLSLALLLYRLMRPRIAVLGLKDTGLHDAKRHHIEPLGGKLGAIRFDGALFFINVAYFEDALIDMERRNPALTHILIKGSGINRIDASGIEMLFNLVSRFKASGITLVFSGLKEQSFKVMKRSGLVREIGPENIFPTDRDALKALRHLWGGGALAEEAAETTPSLAPVAPPVRSSREITVRPVYTGSGPMRILVPVDGTPASTRAVEVAVLMATASPDGEVLLLNAQTASSIGVASSDLVVSQPFEQDELDRTASAALAPGIAICKEAGIDYKAIRRRGPAAEMIVEVTREIEIDHIVMGTRGHGRLRGLLEQSVSTEVLQQATVPVTLVK